MMRRQSRRTVGAVGGVRRGDSGRGQRPSHAHTTTGAGGAQELRAGATGKVVATIEGDTLRKSVAGSRHFLRKPAGIAFDVSILEAARAASVHNVEVYDVETKRTYSASLGDFDAFGFSFDRGFGKQRALALDKWAVRGAGDGRQLSLGLGA